VAHLWFVTIHPFEDGNGRIGRAIADLLLTRSEKDTNRFYSLSSQIQNERKNYYQILEKTQKGDLDITPWIIWFLSCLERSIQQALSTLDAAVYKGKFWQNLAGVSLNDRQRKMINCLLDGFEGKLTTSKWARMTKCSQDTAYRDIVDLLNLDVLTKSSEGGRSTSYFLKQDLRKRDSNPRPMD
jgi:Fic family protein